jgi:hypothetical protein
MRRRYIMRTIETTAVVGEDRKLMVQLPVEVPPGAHRVVVVIDERQLPTNNDRGMENWPAHDVGPWPAGFTCRREDLYGDDGR